MNRGSLKIKRNGVDRNNLQRYKCSNCRKRFQDKKRKKNLTKQIWNKYAHEHAILTVLSKKYNKCTKWIKKQLDLYELRHN